MADTEHSGGEAGSTRPPSLVRAAAAPRRPVDLRAAFALERRAGPVLLLLALLAALLGGTAHTAALVWVGVFAANVAARVLLAAAYYQARRSLPTSDPAGTLLLVSYALDLLLWAAWVGSLVPVDRLAGAPLFALAAAALIASVTLARWPQAWLIWVGGWCVVALLAAARLADATLPAAALLLWGVAVGWLGLGPLRAVRAESGGTRQGWSAALQAIPAPVIVLRRGCVADANAAAAAFFGRDPRALLGGRFEACLRADPAYALDPMVGERSTRTLRVTPLGGECAETAWPARARVLQPGKLDSPVVLALTGAGLAADSFAEDARRLLAWLGARAGQPWYRDDQGRVFLPPEFDSSMPVGADAGAFPLAPWVVPAQHARVEAEYRLAQAQGRMFDRRVQLIDRDGKARTLRVTCLTRAGASPQRRVAIGGLAPADSGAALAGDRGWTESLPAFLWWVDASGLVERVHGGEAWRWGLRQDEASPAALRWSDAFAFDESGRRDMLAALHRALSGRPSFDVLNRRRTRSGALAALRSHVVPYAGPAGERGALVMDTVASPALLTEVERLRRGRDHYRKLVEASTSLIWACDAQFNFTFASKRAAREIYGCEPAELLGRSVGSLLADDADQSSARQALAALRLGQHIRSFEMVQRARDGRRVVVAVDAAPLKGPDGAFAGALGMNANLTTLKQRERRLVEALRIERTVLDAAGQAIAVVKDGRVARCNEAFLKLLQEQPVKLSQTPVGEYLAADGDWSEIAAAADAGRETDRAVAREVQIARGGRGSGQEPIWCQMTARAIAGGEYVLVLADISHIRHREVEALHHAHHDELTGLANRRLLAARGASALLASSLRNSACAVLAIDLDGFKDVNDQHGHEAGDLVLREIAQRLTRLTRPQDTVARLGGDEFAMLVPDAGTAADVERIAQRLLHAVAQPVLLNEAPDAPYARLSASVGIALAPEHGRDLERLLQLADVAMYEAKVCGKNRYMLATDGDAAAGGGAAVAAQAAAAPRSARAS